MRFKTSNRPALLGLVALAVIALGCSLPGATRVHAETSLNQMISDRINDALRYRPASQFTKTLARISKEYDLDESDIETIITAWIKATGELLRIRGTAPPRSIYRLFREEIEKIQSESIIGIAAGSIFNGGGADGPGAGAGPK